jgi:hypothetical protein
MQKGSTTLQKKHKPFWPVEVYLVVAQPNIEADEVGTMGVGVSQVWSSFSWDPPQAALVSNLWPQEIDD